MTKAKKIGYYNLNKSFIVTPSANTTYTYTNPANNSLVLWTRMKSSGPEDLGPNNLSPLYENTPSFSDATFGNKTYPAAQFNDAGDDSAYVTSTSGLLSFSSVASGGTPTTSSDEPFSVSLWVKVDVFDTASSTSEYLFAKQGNSSSECEYRGYITAFGHVNIKLEDEANGGVQAQVYTASGIIQAKRWYHLVFTYDGAGGSPGAKNGLNIYVNGEEAAVTRAQSSSYAGMQPRHNNPLYIGGEHTGDQEINGSMSEFAIWSKELTDHEIKAVYYATTMGSHELISGYLNNPPRILLQDQDNRLGSYPSIIRTGDPSFVGNKSVYFDDTNTIEFRSSYASAEIDFAGIPNSGDFVNLYELGPWTQFSPGGTHSYSFTFKRNSYELPSLTGVVEVDISGIDQISGQNLIEVVAQKFAQVVSSTMSTLEAVSHGTKVKLRYKIQNLPVSISTNLLNTGSIDLTTGTGFLPAGIKPFTQIGPENYAYPFILDEKSQYKNQRISSPNFVSLDSSINAPAIMSPGVSDVGINLSGSTEELFTPFNESRIVIDDTAFFQVGTPEDVLPGFSQKLSSKTSFSVDINPTKSTDIFFSTGSISAATTPSPVNSGLSYYNFKDRQWEIIGDLTTGSNVDYLNSNFETFAGSMLAVTPAIGYASSDGVNRDKTIGSFGLPDPAAGFPVASKFDATGSQLLKISDYISAPFLLEKVVIEMSGALGAYPHFNREAGGSGVANVQTGWSNTVMLLNQFATPINHTFEGTILYATGTSPSVRKQKSQNHLSTRNKDIILYGKIATYCTGVDGDGSYTAPLRYTDLEWKTSKTGAKLYDASYPVSVSSFGQPGGFPLSYSGTPVGSKPRYFYTGSIRLDLVPKTLAQSKYNTYGQGTRRAPGPNGEGLVASKPPGVGLPLSSTQRKWSFGITTPGRNLHGLSSGRSYIKGVTGAQPVDETAGSGKYPTTTVWESGDLSSPYLLLPQDELILAFANQSYPDPGSIIGSGKNNATSESYAANTVSTRLAPGLGKITFYGSLIGQQKPVPFELNQNLTSDAIHEDVRDNLSPYGESRCLDQFDVEPITSYRKGYLDNIISGQMGVPFVDSDGYASASNAKAISDYQLGSAPVGKSARQVVASIVDGQAGTTGSLQRFVRVKNEDKIFYDSTTPNLTDVISHLNLAHEANFRTVPNRWGAQIYRVSAGKAYTGTANDVEYQLDPDNVKITGSFAATTKWSLGAAYEGIETLRRSTSLIGSFKAQQGGPQSSFSGSNLVIDSVSSILSASAVPREGIGIPGNPASTYWPQKYIISVPEGTPKNVSALFLSTFSWKVAGLEGLVKQIYGIGDFQGLPLSSGSFYNTSSGWQYGYKSSILLRGYKYGLCNVLPTSPAAVFRHDTYGQFRDMLESPFQSRSFVKEGTDLKLDESDVFIVFVDRANPLGDNVATNSVLGTVGVDPLTTNSQNLSIFATSSVPYFDGNSRERGKNTQPDLIPNSQNTITFG